MENLNKITKTIEGYEVKDLRFLTVDNIIVGFVKCPIWGKPTRNNGFVTAQWRKNGTPIKSGKGRKDLNLMIIK